MRLLFKFISEMNEKIGRHRGREGRSQCMLCDEECECVLLRVVQQRTRITVFCNCNSVEKTLVMHG